MDDLDEQQKQQQRKANLRVALILGAIAALAGAYPFFFLSKVLSGGFAG